MVSIVRGNQSTRPQVVIYDRSKDFSGLLVKRILKAKVCVSIVSYVRDISFVPLNRYDNICSIKGEITTRVRKLSVPGKV